VPINNVSFGSVIAVSGKSNKINKVNKRLKSEADKGNVLMKDVTEKYVNSSASMVIAEAAQNGDRVEIYITGDDAKKVRAKHPEYDTIDGILSHMGAYFKIDKLSVGEIISRIFER